MNDVLKFLKKLSDELTGYVIVGVSYGPDSMALLDLIKNNLPHVKIVCAHVHHNHRKESDEEASRLRTYCNDNKILFEMLKIEKYAKKSFSEEEARKKRYAFFKSLASKYDTRYVFTAHHGDDLVETVLMRIVRGSTLKGYGAISLISSQEDYTLVRPLLFVTKNDLLTYCDVKKIPYAIDVTNDNDNYTRNRYRKYMLPFLKRENPNVHRQFLMFSTTLNEYDKYVSKEVNKVYDVLVQNNSLLLNELLKQDKLIIKLVIYKFVKTFTNLDDTSISFRVIDDILSFLINNKPSGELYLPKDYRVVKDYGRLFIDKQENEEQIYCYELSKDVVLPSGSLIQIMNKLDDTSNYTSAFLSSEINMPIFVRNKRDGDHMVVLGINKDKKIKDIFINEKISKRNRKAYPVVVDSSGEVIWLPGVKKSKYDRSKQGKYDIILKYLKEGNNDCTK